MSQTPSSLRLVLGTIFGLGLILLVVERGVGWGRNKDLFRINVFVDDSDWSILVIAFASTDRAVRDNGKDPEHPQEYTNATPKNKRDDSSLPWTQGHKRIMNAHPEVVTPLVEPVRLMIVVELMVGMAVDLILLHLDIERAIVSFQFGLVELDVLRRSPNERQDMEHPTMDVITWFGSGSFDDWKAKGLAKGIGYGYGLVFDGFATGRTSSGLRMNEAKAGGVRDRYHLCRRTVSCRMTESQMWQLLTTGNNNDTNWAGTDLGQRGGCNHGRKCVQFHVGL